MAAKASPAVGMLSSASTQRATAPHSQRQTHDRRRLAGEDAHHSCSLSWPTGVPRCPSGQDQAPTLRLRNRIAELLGGIDPKANCILCVAERGFLGGAVRHTPRQFRHLRDERPVLFAPIDDDFVFDHCREPSFAFRITDRTCFTWYGFACAPALCKLIYSSTPLLRNSTRSERPTPQAGVCSALRESSFRGCACRRCRRNSASS